MHFERKLIESKPTGHVIVDNYPPSNRLTSPLAYRLMENKYTVYISDFLQYDETRLEYGKPIRLDDLRPSDALLLKFIAESRAHLNYTLTQYESKQNTEVNKNVTTEDTSKA